MSRPFERGGINSFISSALEGGADWAAKRRRVHTALNALVERDTELRFLVFVLVVHELVHYQLSKIS